MNSESDRVAADAAAEAPPSASRWFWALRAVALSPLVIAVLFYALHAGFRAEMNDGLRLLVEADREGLRAWGEALGARAALATTLLMVAQGIAAPIPAVVVTMTNSLLFGWVWGGLLSIASATFAAWVCFVIGRVFGIGLVSRLVSRKAIDKTDRFLEQHGAATILGARLLPFVPFDPISYLAGVSGMRTWTFLWATFAGQIPAGFAYSYLAHVEDPGRLPIAILVTLATLTLIGLGFRTWWRRRVAAPSASPSIDR